MTTSLNRTPPCMIKHTDQNMPVQFAAKISIFEYHEVSDDARSALSWAKNNYGCIMRYFNATCMTMLPILQVGHVMPYNFAYAINCL